jgi:hypothetical protein
VLSLPFFNGEARALLPAWSDHPFSATPTKMLYRGLTLFAEGHTDYRFLPDPQDGLPCSTRAAEGR